MRTRELVAALAVVLVSDVAVVAARSGDGRAPGQASAADAANVTGAKAAPAPAAAAPKPKPKPKAKPKPPPRLVFSTTTDGKLPKTVMSVATSGGAAKVERLPGEPAHAVSKAAGLVVAAEVLDSNQYSGCGFAGCSTTTFTESGIVVRNLAGGSRRVLTKGGFDTSPSFSPDGSSIAYLSHVTRKADGSETDVVELIATTGESLRTYLAPGRTRYSSPVWSPDGRWIAVVQWQDDYRKTPSLVLLPVGAGSPRTIAHGRFIQLWWAPSARFLVARGEVRATQPGQDAATTTGHDLWVAAVSGVPARRLTRLAPARHSFDLKGSFCGQYPNELGVLDALVSPDSRTVAYVTNAPHRNRAGRRWDIEVVNADGTGRRTVWRAPAPRCSKSVAIVGETLPPADSAMVTDSMTTFSFGLPAPGVPMESMAATTSRPFVTLPNSEYCGGRRTPESPLMMKNWLPLVFGPALAMASEPSS